MNNYKKSAGQGLPSVRQWAYVGVFGVALGVLFFALPALTHLADQPVTKVGPDINSPDTFKATQAQWATLKLGEVQSLPFYETEQTDGKIATDDDTTTQVFSQYSGRVVRVFAKAGDDVHVGDALVEVEASEFVQGQNDLVSAKAQVSSASAQLRLAESAERRQHDLFDAKGTSFREWQQSQADLAAAESAYRTAEIALAAVRGRFRILGKSEAEIDLIENQTAQHHANPVAVVRAPISGRIIQRQVGVGEYINSAANAGTSIFSIGDLSRVWMVAKVPETEAPGIKLGQSVEVKVLAFPDMVINGRVTYVAPSIDPDTRRLMVRAEIPNSGLLLKPEMFANFRITTGEKSVSLAIPEAAVIHEGEKAHAWLADNTDEAHVLKYVEVKLGRRDGNLVEVAAGLKAGDFIVTSGALFIDRAAKND
jgi:membrane fusion protein, heavy metal efflux system